MKKLKTRAKNNKFINPIIAEKMPPTERIREILRKVRDQECGEGTAYCPCVKIWRQVWDKAWTEIRNQVWDQIWAQRGQAWAEIWDEIYAKVWAEARKQIGNPIWNEVWNQRDQVSPQTWAKARNYIWTQIWAQVGIIAYYAVKLFMNIKYEHPAFDLLRLGVVTVNMMDKVKVFGKNGKYLGEIPDEFVRCE